MAQEVEWSSTYPKIRGLIPDLCSVINCVYHNQNQNQNQMNVHQICLSNKHSQGCECLSDELVAPCMTVVCACMCANG